MTTDPYGDADLVALYDLDNPAGADHDYYCRLATSLDAVRIVDLGCGTGLLTRALALAGRCVVGIDPSRTMLDWARRQPGARGVTWILGDATSIPATGDVDLVVCTGNTIMHMDGTQLTAALTRIHQALRPGGVVSFEARNPSAREWERWTKEATWGQRDTALGRLVEWLEVTDVTGDRVTFEAHNVVPGGEDRVYTTVLHFRDARSYERALVDAGFDAIETNGGWQGEDVTDSSPVVVFRGRSGKPL